ncbi:hypothetical protein NQ042_10520 [Corynebacterium phoceense]|uniref:hypothetical protein n=1 Tax=Corynebacterium phoceense TaxID=1686286 RepID=UPI00211C999A|nr:hypothetical protein [Corynebacterium phoceense]MCQ9334498.1 hypothetical protein [Corynebacterium phoceense]
MAALAGVAMYSWGKREQDFFTHELDRRGLDESRNAWLNTDYEVPSDEPGLDTPRFDSFSDAQTVLTVGSLDTLAAAIDDVIVGDDGRVPGALPSVEVLEDLHLTGASPEAIEAFEEGTEISDISPSDLLETQPTKEPSLEYTPPEETLDNAPTL